MKHPDGNRIRFHAAVGTRLKECRERAGLTLSALAKQCEATEGHLGKIEQGETAPGLYLMHKLAHFYDVLIDELTPVV